MADFHELDSPREAHLGWYITTSRGINEYLHDDGQIHMGVCDSHYQSNGYFESEYEAHKSAEQYYLKNARKYPYTNLLNAAYNRDVNDSSQIMNF